MKVSNINMEETILPKSDQVNADWFLSGPQTYVIEKVEANGNSQDQPINVWLRGVNVPYRPSKSMRRVLVAVYGPDSRNYVGKSITLFNNPTIKFGGVACGGIQISHMSDIDKTITLMLTISRSKRQPFTVHPLEEPKAELPPEAQEKEVKAAQQAARDAANEGRTAFNDWWKNNANLRDLVRPIMDELKVTVEERESLRDEQR